MRTIDRQPFPPRLLRRAAISFVISWMFAGAAPAFAQITLNVHDPFEGATYGEPIRIGAFVTSPTEVLSVTATAGGGRDYQTYVLVSNATASDADLEVTFIREDGTAVEKTYSAAAGARLSINASALPELADSNFATIVESINRVPINVESAIYWNTGGVVWEAGGNTVATPIP